MCVILCTGNAGAFQTIEEVKSLAGIHHCYKEGRAIKRIGYIYLEWYFKMSSFF